MRLATLGISNYKSFWDEQNMQLTPGFNVIIGQNNVGKTSLLSVLSLQFTGKPHRSVLSIPRPGSPVRPHSIAKVQFILSGEELSDLLLTHGQRFFVPVPLSEQRHEPHKGKALLKQILGKREVTFTLELVGEDAHLPTWKVTQFPSHGLYESKEPYFYAFDVAETRTEFNCVAIQQHQKQHDFGFLIAQFFAKKIYFFHAERLNVGSSRAGHSNELKPNASNLPEVLSVLQGSNPKRFAHFNELVHKIFPSVCQISIKPKEADNLDIAVWTDDPEKEREDLAIELRDSGTGIGQVLAILYVVITSNEPRVIIIDEPNSFLHPGAAKKLIEILRNEFPQHQYIVSTHSPEIIKAANPSTLTLIRWEKPKSVLEQSDPTSVDHMQNCLVEVGAKLSDVFGTDAIFWVEGLTEEVCFRLILAKLAGTAVRGMSILGVRNTGDFESKRPSVRDIWGIYNKFSKGNALVPPAIAFVFDRDGRKKEEMEDLIARSSGKLKFLPRRMYENYLICPDGLAAVMNQLETFRGAPVSSAQIRNWLTLNGGKQSYGLPGNSSNIDITETEWLVTVNASKLLQDLFQELSSTREFYRKTVHSVQLTEWLINNKADHLQELVDFIKECIPQETMN